MSNFHVAIAGVVLMLGSFASALGIINVYTNNCSKDDYGLKLLRCHCWFTQTHAHDHRDCTQKPFKAVLSFTTVKHFFNTQALLKVVEVQYNGVL